MAYDHAMMLDDSNQFAFTCPNFGAEVQARVCFKLHNLFMVGRPHEKRKGCSACMLANKCPVGHMVKEQLREGDNRYYSDTPKVGRLSSAIIERIRPLGVLESTLNNYAVNSAERLAIEAASGISGDKSAHRRTVEVDDVHIHHTPKPRRKIAKSPKSEEAIEEPAEDSTVTAAISGDMSAALTRATEVIKLSPEESARFVEVLENPPKPSEAAKTAAKAYKATLAEAAPKPTAKPAAPPKGLSLLELAKRKKEAVV